MNYTLLIAVVFTIVLTESSVLPAQDYKISSYQDVYTEIDNYKSIIIELQGDPSWEKRFELDFDFPYFDKRFDHLYFTQEGYGYFEDYENSSLDLLSFGYEFDPPRDTFNLKSDVRYKLTTKDGLKALVIQFTKNRLYSDNSIAIYDSYINFQCWFFENGTIELRFGDINLDNSPVYVKGEGFYLLTNQGPKLIGPFVGLNHPNDQSRSIGVYGAYDSFQIVNEPDLLTTLPPEGWVIRFENILVSSKEVPNDKVIAFFPNPLTDIVNINGISEGTNITVIDQLGHVVQQKEYYDYLDLSHLEKGIYFVRFNLNKQWITHKLIKL